MPGPRNARSHRRPRTRATLRSTMPQDLRLGAIADGAPQALDRAWEAKEEHKLISGMVKEWLSASEVYARALQKFSKCFSLPCRHPPTTVPSLDAAYEAARQCIAKSGTWLAGAVAGVRKFHAAFGQVRAEQSRTKRALRAEWQKLERRLQKVEDTHAIARKAFEHSCRDAERIIAKRDKARREFNETGTRWSKVTSLEQQVHRAITRCKESERVYSDTVRDLRSMQVEAQCNSERLIEALGDEERTRARETAELLSKLARTLNNVHASAGSEALAVMETVRTVNIEQDLVEYVRAQAQRRGWVEKSRLRLACYHPYENGRLRGEGVRVSCHELRAAVAPSTVEEFQDSIDVFKSRSAREIFRQYLAKERSGENLAFWEANLEYMHRFLDHVDAVGGIAGALTQDQTLNMRALEDNMLERFVKKGAREQVNISRRMKDKVLERRRASLGTGRVDPLLFLEASNEIWRVMKRDTLRRFLRSPEFKEFTQHRKLLLDMARMMRDPPPLGLYSQNKLHGYRNRSAILGRDVLEWIQSRLYKFNRDGSSVRVPPKQVAEGLCDIGALVCREAETKTRRFADNAYYGFGDSTLCKDRELLMFAPRNVDISQRDLDPTRARGVAWRVLLSPRILSLDLSRNPTMGLRAHALLFCALQYNKALTSLNLEATRCNGVALVHLSAWLAKSPSIRSLNLSNNAIDSNGNATDPSAMAAAMRGLDIATGDGAQQTTLRCGTDAFLIAMRENRSLRALDMSKNGLDGNFARRLANALEESKSERALESIDLSGNIRIRQDPSCLEGVEALTLYCRRARQRRSSSVAPIQRQRSESLLVNDGRSRSASVRSSDTSRSPKSRVRDSGPSPASIGARARSGSVRSAASGSTTRSRSGSVEQTPESPTKSGWPEFLFLAKGSSFSSVSQSRRNKRNKEKILRSWNHRGSAPTRVEDGEPGDIKVSTSSPGLTTRKSHSAEAMEDTSRDPASAVMKSSPDLGPSSKRNAQPVVFPSTGGRPVWSRTEAKNFNIRGGIDAKAGVGSVTVGNDSKANQYPPRRSTPRLPSRPPSRPPPCHTSPTSTSTIRIIWSKRDKDKSTPPPLPKRGAPIVSKSSSETLPKLPNDDKSSLPEHRGGAVQTPNRARRSHTPPPKERSKGGRARASSLVVKKKKRGSIKSRNLPLWPPATPPPRSSQRRPNMPKRHPPEIPSSASMSSRRAIFERLRSLEPQRGETQAVQSAPSRTGVLDSVWQH